jgi:hypothetical protein
MNVRSWVGVAAVALLSASCAPAVYNSGTPTSSQSYDVTNFNGQWQLAVSRSDNGRAWLEEQTRLGVDDYGATADRTRRTRYGAWFLPDAFHIDGDRQALRIQDENGDLIADVDFTGDYRDGSYSNRDTGNRGAKAHWVSNRRFQVERVGRNGQRITQTFTLVGRTRQLEVGTQVESDAGTRTYTRVYDRT